MRWAGELSGQLSEYAANGYCRVEKGSAVNDPVNDLPYCKHFYITGWHAVTC
jgi:hypothetical protein